MSKDWATHHLLYFVTTLTGVVSGCVLLSFSPACSCHTFSCEEPPVWSMLCSPIIIQHYKKIWCGVARTRCVPAWEWWAVVKCFAWVWTEINGGATSEQQSLFLWLFNNLWVESFVRKLLFSLLLLPSSLGLYSRYKDWKEYESSLCPEECFCLLSHTDLWVIHSKKKQASNSRKEAMLSPNIPGNLAKRQFILYF